VPCHRLTGAGPRKGKGHLEGSTPTLNPCTPRLFLLLSFRVSVLFDGSLESLRLLPLEHMIEAEDRVRRVAAKKTAAKKGFGAPTAAAAAAAASETQAFE